MKLKLTWLLTLFMAFVMQFSFAQEKTVTGTVTTVADGLPLPGASVIVKGTSRGQQTDFDGKYTIQVNQGDILVISYVGMEPGEVLIGSGSTYDVALEDASTLDEVIVVGYGTTTKDAFTGTATKIETANVEAKAVSNVSEALRGEVAGVNVISYNGAPGSDATIRIRGFGSVNGNSDPLYIVDGAPYASDLSSINPADIESMTVLKDAAATSIYGSRGANGVIVITTKLGKSGKTVVSVDFKTSVNTLLLPQYDVVESPEQYIELSWQALKNKGALQGESDPAAWASANLYGTTEGINSHYNIWDTDGANLINPATGEFNSGVNRVYTPTKWSDAAFSTGIRTEANIQLSGGNERTRFSTSFGYLKDEGFTINSGYDRYSTRLNVEDKPADWLTVGANISFTGSKYENSSSSENSSGSSGNIFALTSSTPAIYDVYLRDDNGALVEDPIYGGYQFDYGATYGRRAWNSTNGIGDATYDLARTDVNTMLGNFNVGIDITENLKFETRYSGQLNTTNYTSMQNPYYGSGASSQGYLFKRERTNINQNFLQMLRYSKQFGAHNVEAFVAHESTVQRFTELSAAAQTAIIPRSTSLDQYTTAFGKAGNYTLRRSLDSYFSQVNYNYDQKYFFTGSVRRDGSSRFIQDKWGTFGSVGLGWVISNEDFFSGVDFMDYLKLKGSFGIIGDQGVNTLYGYNFFTINTTADGSISYSPSGEAANPELTWETSKIAQVGLESTWFNGYLDLDIDYYVKNTTNLFFTQTLPTSPGDAFIRYNDGEMRNKGFEFNAQVHVIKNHKDFRLSFNVNGEIFDNEITQMPNDFITGERQILDTDDDLSQGRSIYDWYLREWAGVDPATGAGLWYAYFNDVDGDGIFNAANGDASISSLTQYKADNPDANIVKTVTSTYAYSDESSLGATEAYVGKSAIPKIRGSFRLNTGYKNFDLSAQFGYSIGGYVYDNGYATLMNNRSLIGTNNYHSDAADAWSEPGDITNIPRLSAGYSTDVNYASASSRFLTKADYLSLNNIKISYSLPNDAVEAMNLKRFNIFITGDNVMMLSARSGLNPTTFIGSSNSGIYMPRTAFTLGAKIEF
ncbi:SusC/RagA family TonB-linked outer membrane protein [Winogradskyella psychrotolerans]|uniref:SusC/RagA family TonB-linked outer membrane protein n=1 Tax=Winogradskyella psychrotolerans TaxID=1344585 RepID=UPI001C07B984|nr:SusC/RagA family TonB-linked outer membrane protein [Winogradskyella psychrotolerans]MBU2929267.1 SusC/RagA family TonB-linked outer membrane protein [Winogradskyella psychrotolerans]